MKHTAIIYGSYSSSHCLISVHDFRSTTLMVIASFVHTTCVRCVHVCVHAWCAPPLPHRSGGSVSADVLLAFCLLFFSRGLQESSMLLILNWPKSHLKEARAVVICSWGHRHGGRSEQEQTLQANRWLNGHPTVKNALLDSWRDHEHLRSRHSPSGPPRSSSPWAPGLCGVGSGAPPSNAGEGKQQKFCHCSSC